MRKSLLGIAFAAATGAAPADVAAPDLPPGVLKRLAARCESCATVQEVRTVRRPARGQGIGIVSFAGDELEKLLTGREVWVTRVRLRDGRERSFEQDHPPNWRPGSIVRIKRNRLTSL